MKEKHALNIHQHNPADIEVPAAAPTLSAQVGDSQILITKTKLLPLLLFLLCTPIHAPLIGNSPPLLRYCLTVTGMPFHRTRVRCPKPTKAAIFDSFVIFSPTTEAFLCTLVPAVFQMMPFHVRKSCGGWFYLKRNFTNE